MPVGERFWKPEDVSLARDLYLNGHSFEAVANTMGRTTSSVSTKLWKSGITRVNDKKRKGKAARLQEVTSVVDWAGWAGSLETRLVKYWYDGVAVEEIARRLDRTLEDVELRAKALKLHDRSAKTFAEAKRGRRFRECRSCHFIFMSEGHGNRLCGCADTSGPNDIYASGFRKR